MSWDMPTSGKKKKAIVTFKNGKVQIDLKGFKDSSCKQAMDKLTSHLKVVKHEDRPEAMIPQKEKDRRTLIN